MLIIRAINPVLSWVIGSLVNPDQACSVPSRSISSNLSLLHDVLDYIYSFLFNLLSHFSFGPDF